MLRAALTISQRKSRTAGVSSLLQLQAKNSSIQRLAHARLGIPLTRRSYIFLPTSVSEWKETLIRLWDSHKEKRRAVFVKLLTKVEHRKQHALSVVLPDATLPPPTMRTRVLRVRRRLATLRPVRGKIRKRQSLKDTVSNQMRVLRLYKKDAALAGKSYYKETTQALRQKFRNAHISAASTLHSSSAFNSFMGTNAQHHPESLSTYMTQLFKARRKSTRAKFRWVTRKIWIDEPMDQDWFDKDGFPLAVRNPFGRFVNPWNSESTNGMQSLFLFLKWRLERLQKFLLAESKTMSHPTLEASSSSILSSSSATLDPNKIRLTWIGHSTTLVQMQGYTILTDPHFSPRASPFQIWPVGVGRHVPPALDVEDLPPVNVCVISHDHYDHLDTSSVRQLVDKVQVWAVPLGIKEWLQEHCEIPPERIVEMTWWQRATLQRDGTSGAATICTDDDNDNPTTVSTPAEEESQLEPHELHLTCAPAQHWCGRTMWDRNQRLWCSWAIQAGPLKFYFGGDTGLPNSFPLHRQIGDRLGPFDLSALPIGAYAPRYFMKSSHVHPREAVQIHQHVQAKKSVAIHWGTFHLADEDDSEAKHLLEEAARQAGVDFGTVLPGGVVETEEKALEKYENRLETVPPLHASQPCLRNNDDEQEQHVGYG